MLALGVALSLAALALAALPLPRASAATGDTFAPSWVQPLQPHSIGDPDAVSSDGSRLYVAIGGWVEAYDTVTHLPIGEAAVPGTGYLEEPTILALAAGSDGSLYGLDSVTVVTTGANGTNNFQPRLEVVRFDFATGGVTGRTFVGTNGSSSSSNTGLLLSADGSQAYALSSGNEVDVISAASVKVVHSWMEQYGSAGTVFALADGLLGNWAPVGSSAALTSQLGVFDPATGTVTRTIPARTPSFATGVFADPVGMLPDGVHEVQLEGSLSLKTMTDVVEEDMTDGSTVEIAHLPAPQPGWSFYGSPTLSSDDTTLFLQQRSASDTEITAVDLSTGTLTSLTGVPATQLDTLLSGPGDGLLVDTYPGNSQGSVLYEFSAASPDALPSLVATAQPSTSNLQVGEIATVSTGSWSASPDSLSYQWYDDFAPIPGATSASLAITGQMYEHNVDVVVTASKTGYTSGTVTTALWWDGPTSGTLSTAVPIISGTARLGSTLTANPGTWTNGTTFAFQWNAGGAAITGATGKTYTVTSAEEGKTLTVTATGTLQGYTTASSTSAATAKVPVVAYHPAVKPALAGSDRYATAIAISKSSYPLAGSAKTVVITSGENFPDALSAAPAAVKLGGPLLLTPHDHLPANVAAEVKRLGPQRIVVAGGTSAVSAAVVTSLSKIAPTTRVSGADRYATSLALAKFAFGSTNVPSVFFATGASFADALSASAYGGAAGIPVILFPPIATAIPSALQAWLTSAHTMTLSIAGGYGALSENAQGAIEEFHGRGAFTYAGTDRFDTNRAINAGSFGADYVSPYTGKATAYLASGLNFPDALAGAAAAGKAGLPLYLVEPNCVPGATITALKSAGISTVQSFGGPSAVGAGATRMTACG
ncbi:MAG: cell wall-binding repeat-containing protein [Nocardiaceae bacterium]|nr:cell wall-binding repeat-containing protein [Nocardiaceae bacterium]